MYTTGFSVAAAEANNCGGTGGESCLYTDFDQDTGCPAAQDLLTFFRADIGQGGYPTNEDDLEPHDELEGHLFKAFAKKAKQP